MAATGPRGWPRRAAITIQPGCTHAKNRIMSTDTALRQIALVSYGTWTALLAVIRKDLDIPNHCPPNKPFFAPWREQPDALKLPEFPYVGGLYLPHQLMHMLSVQEEAIKNVLISKNENSYYHNLDQAAASRVDHWAERLNCWIVEVQLRCANEYRAADVFADDPPLVRLVQAPPAPRPPQA
jgi:hypothetical protein